MDGGGVVVVVAVVAVPASPPYPPPPPLLFLPHLSEPAHGVDDHAHVAVVGGVQQQIRLIQHQPVCSVRGICVD